MKNARPVESAPLGVFDTPTGPGRVDRSQIPDPRPSSDAMTGTPPSAPKENRLRGKLVDRLTLMADRHRRHVEERQETRRAVGPHALGFFFADDLTISGTFEVVAATRLLFDSTETADLLTLLDVLIDRATERPPGTFNPRIHMCNREESMSFEPQLLGVGVTTVFEPSPSDSASTYASLGMNRPYRAVAHMEDGTDILLQCGSGFLAHVDVRATQLLTVNGRHTRHWAPLTQAYIQSREGQLSGILSRLSVLLDLAAGRSTGTLTDLVSAGQIGSMRGIHRSRRRVRLRSRGR